MDWGILGGWEGCEGIIMRQVIALWVASIGGAFAYASHSGEFVTLAGIGAVFMIAAYALHKGV